MTAIKSSDDEGWSALGILEDKINVIENRVYSSKNVDVKDDKVLDTVSKTKKSFKEIEVQYPILVQLWKKLNLLEEYLNPEFIERINVTDDSQVELILAGEKQLKTTAATLQDIQSSKEILENKKLQDISQWNSKLNPLVQVHLEQKADSEDTNEKLTKLLAAYNNIISSVSKQFIQWDNVITQCEIALNDKTLATD